MLQKSVSTKYLSVLLDSKLKWIDYINKTVDKTNKPPAKDRQDRKGGENKKFQSGFTK
jgi:hypothetical protein